MRLELLAGDFRYIFSLMHSLLIADSLELREQSNKYLICVCLDKLSEK